MPNAISRVSCQQSAQLQRIGNRPLTIIIASQHRITAKRRHIKMTLEGAPGPTAQALADSSQAFADAYYLRPESSSMGGTEDEEAESFDSPLSSVASFDLDRALQRLALDEQDTDSPHTCPTTSGDVCTASTVFQSASPGQPDSELLPVESGSEADTEGSSACLTFARSIRARSTCHLQILSGAVLLAAEACCCSLACAWCSACTLTYR